MQNSTGFSFWDLFWLLFLISAFQPVLTRWMLENRRKWQIARLENARKSRVILLVHRQETMSFLGFPIMRYIDINDSEAILRVIHTTPDDTPIDLVLHTPGGMVIAATQIAMAVKAHKGKVTVFVPHFAMSGGTLIALGADEIVMSPHATLGPVDPQLGSAQGGAQPAASLLKVLEMKKPADIDDATIVLADQGQKAIAQVQKTATDLLTGTLPEDKAKEVATTLSEGRWTHDHPLFPEDVRGLGLKVSTDMLEDVLDLLALYPQPTQATPSVEYIPHRQAEHRGK